MHYPALDISGVDTDLLEAVVIDFSPTAAEVRDGRATYFFQDAHSRQAAADAVQLAWPSAGISWRDVDDEDWARRSQANLRAVRVGQLIVCPPWDLPAGTGTGPDSPRVLVVNPSMGFGTGHHATTRLCLAALQEYTVADRVLLDVGTGSGVLALAGRTLGARRAVGVDNDPDAIASAQENLEANPQLDGVTFVVGDLRDTALSPADVVTANLSGALLVHAAARLLEVVVPGGRLIVSGLLEHERETVVSAFASADLAWERHEEGWAGLGFNRRTNSAV